MTININVIEKQYRLNLVCKGCHIFKIADKDKSFDSIKSDVD